MSVIVPALNEASNLVLVLPGIPDVHEVILVDGGSVDGTIEAARAARPGIVTLTQQRRGKGNALATGFAAATGDIVVTFDADGSADPQEIDLFVAALVSGADYAKGSRFEPGGGSDDLTALRRAGNAMLSSLANRGFGTGFSDLCYGYNAFWADLLPVLDLPDPFVGAPAGRRTWGDGFEIEAVISCRMAGAEVSITEVPSVERERIHGTSNLNPLPDGARVLRTLVAERVRARRPAARRAAGAAAPRSVRAEAGRPLSPLVSSAS